MAVLGGFILILIGVFLAWVALMGNFSNVGKRVTKKLNKTFKHKGDK